MLIYHLMTDSMGLFWLGLELRGWISRQHPESPGQHRSCLQEGTSPISLCTDHSKHSCVAITAKTLLSCEHHSMRDYSTQGVSVPHHFSGQAKELLCELNPVTLCYTAEISRGQPRECLPPETTQRETQLLPSSRIDPTESMGLI